MNIQARINKLTLLKIGLVTLSLNILINQAANANLLTKNNYPENQRNIKKNWRAQEIENEEKTLEKAVLDEINKARNNPSAYADRLAEIKKYYYDGWLKIPGARAIRTNQGWETIDELIGYLRDRPPLPPLNSASELNLAARELLTEPNAPDTLTQINSSYSNFTANSSYGDTAELIVIQLINNIFNPDFKLTGIACNSVDTYGNYCYIAYANEATQTVENESNSDPTNITEENSTATVVLLEEGDLADNDQIMSSDDSRYDFYPFDGVAGQTITISLESNDFDTYLAIVDSQNNIIAENDDLNQENSNSRLTVTLPVDGVYYIIVNSYDPSGRGEYRLTVSEE